MEQGGENQGNDEKKDQPDVFTIRAKGTGNLYTTSKLSYIFMYPAKELWSETES